jgi:hypothetical protein
MQVMRVTVALDVVVPEGSGCTDTARDAVTGALCRIVDPGKQGVTIAGASVDKVERVAIA